MGLHTEPKCGWSDARVLGRHVVEFPGKLPAVMQLANQTSALEQLEVVRWLQQEWSESAVSVTIYYKLNELEDIQTVVGSTLPRYHQGMLVHAAL